MKRVYYDLHIHSCLSPCADNDMTPANIAGMAALKGLQVVALTDHNTTGNCAAFFEAVRPYPILPLAGMELTTAEEVHMVCLFPTVEAAGDFDRYLDAFRLPLTNRPEIFGEQRLYDGEDHYIGDLPHLLSAATALSLDMAVPAVRDRGGVIFPAHLDRQAHSMISVLGTVPRAYGFTCAEYRHPDTVAHWQSRHDLSHLRPLFNSDAHLLENISEAEHFFDREGATSVTPELVLEWLRHP
ncbi:MAG: PHP domain-containing protein [Eubacteriales bacterium]